MKNTKQHQIKDLLINFIQKLEEGQKPKKLLDFCKDNPELAKDIAPLYHLIRIKMIKEDKVGDIDFDSNKIKQLRNSMIHDIKEIRKSNKKKTKETQSSFNPAVAYRKNNNKKQDNKNHTKEAINRLRKKMNNKENEED